MSASLALPPGLTTRGPRPFLTLHALDRCRQMNVARGEVVSVLHDYETRYPSPASYGPDRFVSVGRRLAVVHTSTLEVITVLWAGRDGRIVE